MSAARAASSADADAIAAAPSLVDSVKAFAEGTPEAERPDALHELFYGFYARVAITDQATHALARWARDDIAAIEDLPPSMAEALRDNALHVGRELFATRIRTMSAMGYVSEQLRAVRDTLGDRPFALQRAVAFDEESGAMRSYDLGKPGEHPDLPYDPFSYDPQAESD
jgi:hypothetical protein